MGYFLLSIASPDSLSWMGFSVLIAAMVGEVGVCLIPSQWDGFHKHATFILLTLAAAGYSIERVGDDAIITALEKRAGVAEKSVTKLRASRVVPNDDAARLSRAMRKYGKRHFWIITQSADPDLSHTEQGLFSLQLSGILAEAGWEKDGRWSNVDPNKVDTAIESVNDRGCHISYGVDLNRAAEDISSELKEAEIDCDTAPDGAIRPTWLVIEIGLR